MKEAIQDAISEGLFRAEQAIACLTKGDVAEIRSFSKPPPAVMMVVKALMVLLTGEAMDWKSAKRVMASGERFLQMMGACMRDRERLPESRIRMLRRSSRIIQIFIQIALSLYLEVQHVFALGFWASCNITVGQPEPHTLESIRFVHIPPQMSPVWRGIVVFCSHLYTKLVL